LAETIRTDIGLPTITVGLITEVEQAEAIVAEGRADRVGLARGNLYDPRWPWHTAAKLGASGRRAAKMLALPTEGPKYPVWKCAISPALTYL